MAATSWRSRPGLRESRASRPSWRSVPHTAPTWPCGSERTFSKDSAKFSTAVPPLSRVRSPSTRGSGQELRLARVRLMTFLPCREDWRNRIQGGEFRLGTLSMYMGTVLSVTSNI